MKVQTIGSVSSKTTLEDIVATTHHTTQHQAHNTSSEPMQILSSITTHMETKFFQQQQPSTNQLDWMVTKNLNQNAPSLTSHDSKQTSQRKHRPQPRNQDYIFLVDMREPTNYNEATQYKGKFDVMQQELESSSKIGHEKLSHYQLERHTSYLNRSTRLN